MAGGEQAGGEQAGGGQAGGGQAGGGMAGGGMAGAAGDAGMGGGGGAGGLAMALWPDSATPFCSDGSVAIDCPAAGAPAHGQDGNFLDNTPSLQAAAGEVYDGLTGLTWQQSELPPGSFSKASTYCQNKATTSMLDWRLPTLQELVSLLDYGRHNQAADLTAFPNITGTPYWTASSSPTSGHWLVDFKEGNLIPSGVFGAIRCVRGSAPGWGQPLDVQADVVADPGSGLIWQRATGPTASWLDALAQCEALSLGGMSGWRLPSIKQLETLGFISVSADFAATFPSPGGEPAFWSSSPRASSPGDAWAMDLSQGGLMFTTSMKGSPRQVRCVRPASL
jgi:hypothetical protein